MMALGFVLVFGAFGLVIAPQVQQYLPIVTVFIGLVLVGCVALSSTQAPDVREFPVATGNSHAPGRNCHQYDSPQRHSRPTGGSVGGDDA